MEYILPRKNSIWSLMLYYCFHITTANIHPSILSAKSAILFLGCYNIHSQCGPSSITTPQNASGSIAIKISGIFSSIAPTEMSGIVSSEYFFVVLKRRITKGL